MEALGINPGFLLVQIVNLVIAYVVISKWIVGPVMGMLEKRRETIAQGLEDARVAAEARANAEKDAQKIVAEAQAKAGAVVREATERAEVAARDVKISAEAEAKKAAAKALAGVEEERSRILGDIRGQVAALAIAATQKLVGDALDEKRQRSLLDEFFAGVKSGKVQVLEGAQISGQSAEVTSALPLTADEQASVKKDVLAKSGAAEVAFRVDPSILGGLVIRVGDKVMDGSVAGKLEGLRANLR
ncbi:MAG: ATP synthase F0 subunit B [Anaerolineae bacterium CG_4_9_14_3_um_filter_57_17]|nr:F0F1 ATP synthase subunit B [bacterium]NCT20056.1 F0F1 ATP synthase subunit B [bacterium]OIO83211.1 MAG: ATP synthase F0 subunit B [Anaerolineae bacterium CG2_30_57_67]PJB65185.1 MAG: ATP synthase F0 subunit B [Anaerolineae bacterium CG_4_9_14_3_um_filter_57_17]